MRRRARRGGGRQAELAIEALGGRGDGVGDLKGRPVFVPFALPGERVRVRLVGEHAAGLRAEMLELLSESPRRVHAPCPHFGPCGGCSLQHLALEAYAEWKQALAGHALARRGLTEAPVHPLARMPERSRRRATLGAVRRGERVALGFRGRASRTIEDIESCLILTPGLLALLPGLRRALAPALEDGEVADVALLESETGADVVLVSRRPPGLRAREALAGFAAEADLARLSWAPAGRSGAAAEPEPLAMRREPVVHLGPVAVTPPPGGFLQPTAAGEAALVETLLAWLPEDGGPVADLYAGCGTFTFPLAARAPVHAVEGDQAALAALARAARRHDLAGRVSAEARDLARRPLEAAELERFATVVFDPPRAGAREQAGQLARAAVPTAIAVSCSPPTFARDARTLVDGGYRLVEVRPIDQFPWSPHLELAALFRR